VKGGYSPKAAYLQRRRMAFKTLLLMFNDNGKLNRATVARVAADPGPDGVERVLFAIVNRRKGRG
jgi:hypothetical protein